MIWQTKQGDTRTALKATITPIEGSMVEVSSVDFWMCDKNFKSIIKRQVNLYESSEVTVVFTAEEVGRSGIFFGEFKLNYTDGKIETVPKTGYIRIVIEKGAE